MHSAPASAASDAELARAWAAGDERAFAAIVDRHAGAIYNRCRMALGSADADDATQAVFLVLARRPHQAADSPVLAAWLMAVAGNVVRNAWRDRRRRRQAETALPPPPPSDAEEPIMPELATHLDACLAQLPPREREAVELHHLAGCTLAEVGAQTGVGISTVRYRIARGLERMRSLLARRGVAMSAVALAACLGNEAQAAVPDAAIAAAHRIAGDRATAPAAPGRVERWARQRPAIARRVAIAAALLLIAAVPMIAWMRDGGPGAASGPAAQPPAAQAATAQAAAAGTATVGIDPARARTWLVLRMNDGARTASRLRAQPEMALLPAGPSDWLDVLASLKAASLIADQDSLLGDAERIASYRAQEGLADLDPQARQERTLELLRMRAARGPEPARSRTPVLSGWIDATAVDAPLIARLRATLDGPDAPPDVHPDGDGWSFATAGGEGRIAIAGGRILLQPPADAAAVPAAVADLAANAAMPEADVEFGIILDPGRPGQPMQRSTAGHLRLGDDGLRFRCVTRDGAAPRPGGGLERQHLDRVPAAAIAAGAMAVRPGDPALADLWTGIAAGITLPVERRHGGVPAGLRSALTACELLLARCDGTLLGWVEPGCPLPSVTVAADLGASDAQAVMRASGLPIAADGTVSALVGPVTLGLGWRDGRLLITTNPAGIAGIDLTGGFTAHPEIRRALAAMPAGRIDACALLRPAACLDLAMPFGAMLVPRLQRPLMDYRARIAGGQAFAFIAGTRAGEGLRIDAAGILALAGCAAMAGQAMDPAARMRIAN